MRRLDRIIDLDFRKVANGSSSDVALYYDTEIDVAAGGNILGLATTYGSDGWWLIVNYPAI